MNLCQVEGCNREVGFHLRKTCSQEHKALYRQQFDRGRYARLRDKVLEHYGKKCVCCGETRKEFLALDHKNGEGQKHRRELGGGAFRMYRWAVRNGYPDTFQILCHNCNMALGCCGYCPHQKEKTEQRASTEGGHSDGSALN